MTPTPNTHFQRHSSTVPILVDWRGQQAGSGGFRGVGSRTERGAR